MSQENLPERKIDWRIVREMGGVNFYSRFAGLAQKYGQEILTSGSKVVETRIANPDGEMTVYIVASDDSGDGQVEIDVFDSQRFSLVKKFTLKKGLIQYSNMLNSAGEADLDGIGVNRDLAVIYRDVSRRLAVQEAEQV